MPPKRGLHAIFDAAVNKRKRTVTYGDAKGTTCDIRTLFARQNTLVLPHETEARPSTSTKRSSDHEYLQSIRPKRFKTTVDTNTAKEAEAVSKSKPKAFEKNPQQLQFLYQIMEGDDVPSLVACTPTHAMKIVGPFDFEDYQTATNSAPFPPMLQKLIQRAIDYYLHPRPVPAYDLCEFSGVLREKQVTALEFILSRDPQQPVILAMGTGLGKTPTAYAWIAVLWNQILQHDDEACVLVVVPANLRGQWRREGQQLFFCKHADAIGMIWSSKTAPRILTDSSKRVIIVSYTMLKTLESQLLRKKWVGLICDEAHSIQSTQSQCTKAIERIKPHIAQNRIVLLTATPADKPFYWTLLKLCEPEIFASFFHYKNPNIPWPRSNNVFHFAEWYVLSERLYTTGGVVRWQFKRMLRRHELHALTKWFVLHQKKEEVMTDVLPMVLQKVNIGRASVEQKCDMEARMAKIAEVSEKKGQQYGQAMLLEQVRETAVNKLPHVLSYIHRLVESDPSLKFIVWAYHKPVMEAISANLTESSIKHILVNGDTPQGQRDDIFEQFKTDSSIRVGVLSVAACGTGFNFTYVQLTVYAELTFLYKPQIQSEGRTFRIGQKGQAIAQYLMFEDSTDSLVWNTLQRKRDNESILLDNKKSDLVAETLRPTEALHFVVKCHRLLQRKLNGTGADQKEDDQRTDDDDVKEQHSDKEDEEEGVREQNNDEGDEEDEQQSEDEANKEVALLMDAFDGDDFDALLQAQF